MSVSDLGHGVLLYEGTDADTLAGLTGTHRRFLDNLWIPTPLVELAPEQIAVVNRFREQRRNSDPQFAQADRSRAAYLEVIEKYADSLLEVGCGKFPLGDQSHTRPYLGLDIDREAIDWCRARGLAVYAIDDVPESYGAGSFRFVVASYVLHFSVSASLLSIVSSVAADDAVFVFNVLCEAADEFAPLLARLAPRWPNAGILKSERMPRREYWFVLSGPDGTARAAEVLRCLETFWRTVP